MDLDSRYPLTKEQTQYFRQKGFVKLKDVLSADAINHYGDQITRKVIDLNTMHVPLEKRSTYDKAFLQIQNIWEKDAVVREFVFGERLARIATELMGCRGVRMYHDQALYKEPSGGHTPWHADQYYWPLETNKSCTAWIPLQATPLDMGPLAFAAGSHNVTFGRDLAISDESEQQIQKAMQARNFPLIEEPFDLGEVSFHYGWTFHRAGPNTTQTPRKVMTIIYIDVDMRLAPPVNNNQQRDWERWCPGAEIGEVINSPINPVMYEQ
ncbi:MAG: phytanoyl-CoA dioxygenase family protein [Lentisphaerae bacterium]|nr:phytanoyl-CoA dioxygenase family protein [Lentisphaerota bacterium]